MQDAVEIYPDGACAPNPGLMAIGVVLVYRSNIREISEKLGQGTNNIAELTAIERGLQLLKRKDVPVRVFSDSQYAINSLSGKWNPSKNLELLYRIQAQIKEFPDIQLQWIRGHNGNKWQERADYLANKDLPEFHYPRKHR